MDLEDAFKMAQESTQFIKVRKNLLYTFGATRLPYICLSPSSEESDSVVIRSGEILAEKPQIAVPGELFSFEGFDDFMENIEENESVVALARRISMPPSKYVNTIENKPRREVGSLSEVIQRTVNQLEADHDVRTAVISTPEEVWGLSIMLYVGDQVMRSAQSNVQEHFERIRFRN